MSKKNRKETEGDAKSENAKSENVDASVEVESTSTLVAPTLVGWRGFAVALVVCGLFFGVMARAYELQVGRAEDLGRQALDQVTGSIEIRARRGAILDREGREMAISVHADSVFVRPRQIVGPREVARQLAPLLGRSEASLFDSLSRDGNFRYLARHVSPQVAEAVRALDIEGVETTPEWQRYYPMRFRAGHVIGFTGVDDNGLEGVERAFDTTLSGGVMEVSTLRDARGRTLISTESPELTALEGASVVLTIDSRIQRIVERELETAVIAHQARTGVVVVTDPDTGEILAMANWPPFDPNQFRSHGPDDWRNRAVTDVWEPGSTLKIFTYASALEAGVLGPDTLIETGAGYEQIGRHRIRDTSGHGTITAWQVIQMSSNIGAYRMGAMMGERNLYNYFRAFGFGQRTGLGLSGEQYGLLAETPWAEIELANRAFGQGVSTTPIQLAMAYGAIANGGELMVPSIVREVRNRHGDVLQTFEPEVRRRVVSEHNASLARRALWAVTQEGGTGSRATVPGIPVAGKTGTAQKVNPETGRYDDLWMASFIGFVPAEDPEFTIVVMIDEPQDGHYGGTVAGPVFSAIAEQSLAIRGIFADHEPEEDAAEPVDVVESSGIVPDIAPISAVPLSGQRRDAPGERVTVPDLTGRGLLAVLRQGERLGLEVIVHGWGNVRHQWPAVGASVRRGSAINVYLQTPYGDVQPDTTSASTQTEGE